MTTKNPDRFRNYVFTLNNYTTEELSHLEKLKCKYIIYGREIGEQGTPHLQGFVIWNNAKSFNATKKQLSQRAHIEVCKGTPYDNFVYCSKDGDFTERGERPERVGQGKRNDMIAIKKAIAQNIQIKKCLQNDLIHNYQQLRFAESLQKYYEKPRTFKTVVHWYWGLTGTGKTKTAYEELLEEADDPEEIYFSMDTGKWWEGYDGHKYVVIDDMRGDFLKCHQLLKLLDRYPYRVDNKGASRQFVAEKIIITSCYPPELIYQNTDEKIDQLIRRIDYIKEFKQEKEEEEPLFKGIQFGPHKKKHTFEEIQQINTETNRILTQEEIRDISKDISMD